MYVWKANNVILVLNFDLLWVFQVKFIFVCTAPLKYYVGFLTVLSHLSNSYLRTWNCVIKLYFLLKVVLVFWKSGAVYSDLDDSNLKVFWPKYRVVSACFRSVWLKKALGPFDILWEIYRFSDLRFRNIFRLVEHIY